MKKILPIILTVATLNFSAYSQPCQFANLGIKVNSEVPGPNGTCIINFDMYFDIDHNAGGKYFWFHVWPTDSYTNYNYNSNKAPTTANGGLTNSVLTFGFDHFQFQLTPMTSYLPDPGVQGFVGTYTISEVAGATFDRYTAKGLYLTLPQGCNVSQPLTIDAWQTQAENGNNIHCFVNNVPIILNDPTITGGLLFCEIPRTYRFDINTKSVAQRTVNYKVFIDNGDGIFNAGLDTIQINSGTEIISSTTPFHSPRLGYAPYNSTKPYSDRSLWVVILANGTDIPNEIYALIANSCVPLPVQLTQFTAQRNKMQVTLKWTTASENNNKGFYIERQNGIGNWQTLAFVNTMAFMGNSATDLNYSYTDINDLNGLTQYRLRQVDIDNKATLSDVRIVKGLDQLFNVRIFPNPTSDGQLVLVMDKADKAADITLIDMSGKITAQWNHFTGNRLQIHSLTTGLYVLKVWINGEKEPQMLRVMVTK
jgi:hypothetical protein